MTIDTSRLNLDNIIRTVAVAVVAMPLSLSLSGLMGTQNELNRRALETSPQAEEIETLKAEVQLPCIRYATSKVDSKGEREAKSAIDDLLGVDVGDYARACGFLID